MDLRIALLGWLLVTGTCSAQSPTQSGQSADSLTVFEGASLIVGDGSPLIEDAVFLVEGARFRQVGRRGEIEIPAAVRRFAREGGHFPWDRSRLCRRRPRPASRWPKRRDGPPRRCRGPAPRPPRSRPYRSPRPVARLDASRWPTRCVRRRSPPYFAAVSVDARGWSGPVARPARC